jgi:hypothetical protein
LRNRHAAQLYQSILEQQYEVLVKLWNGKSQWDNEINVYCINLTNQIKKIKQDYKKISCCATALASPVGCCCATGMLRNGDKATNLPPDQQGQVIICVISPPTSIKVEDHHF